MNVKLIIIIAVLIVVLVFFMAANMKHNAPIEWIGIKSIDVSEQTIDIDGFIVAGIGRYRGYEYKIVDGSVYITIKTSWLSGLFPGGDKIDIYITGDFKDTKRVFLTNSSENKAIWTKK